MPKVSVIVPFYNVGRYIEKCLDSLVNQTLEDIEIILINDGSQDNSYQIAKDYEKKYPNKIKSYEKPNGGLGDARNFGINYATGEYIAFLDSDDYVEHTMYEEMYEVANREFADMVECDFWWEYPKKQKEDIGLIYESQKDMLQNARVVAWNKLIKTEIYKNHPEVRFAVGLRYEDVEGFYKILPYIKKVSYVRKCFIHYVQRQGSISNTQNKKNQDIFTVLDNVITYYKEKGLYDQFEEELEYIYTRYLLCSSFLRIVKIKDKDIKKELLNKTWENLNKIFPNWKKNKILKEDKSMKNLYIRSVNKFTFTIYSYIFR
jgi:glycosyltransferase involved in cell wall biosynthesis